MGGMRFIAYAASTSLNSEAAKGQCKKQNATLPRYQPMEPIGDVHLRFGTLSQIYGQYIHIWLDSCAQGSCNVWAIDVRSGHHSHYKTLAFLSEDSTFFVLCERGEPHFGGHACANSTRDEK